MKEQLSLHLAAVKRWLKRVAPPIFALLKALNQWRERLWASPLAYVWRNSHLGHAFGLALFRLTQGRLSSASTSYLIFDASLRLHRYQQASWMADAARRRWPDAIDVVAMQCTLALRAGALPEALALLEHCLFAADYRAVDRVLFRTGSRPRDLQQSDEVFRWLSHRADLDLTRRSYALVADAYLILRLKRVARAPELVSALEAMAERLRSDRATTCCPQSNRQNLGKLYVSISSALYHLALLEGDMPLLARCWQRFADFSRAIDRDRMNADALFRMSSNLGRGLALGFLLDPRQHGTVRSDALTLLNAWTTANAAGLAPRRRIRGRTPQENHLLFLKQLQNRSEELHRAGDAVTPQACRHWARLLNHSSEGSLTDTIAALVQRQLNEPEP
ncbi:hypothetical protein [Synechococcus sp. KORDI-52]|uniref:hypothetical protein n=1 Tax=Synechococcus sp. KORDI-52 TaxID=585425 RepID=UPI0012EB12CA|nr:hypothetical protein [Synechococcus sp. KORDI-52]